MSEIAIPEKTNGTEWDGTGWDRMRLNNYSIRLENTIDYHSSMVNEIHQN
jgi:hypothetical protein